MVSSTRSFHSCPRWALNIVKAVTLAAAAGVTWAEDGRPVIGYVIGVENAVSITSLGAQPRPAALRQEVFTGDKIESGPASSLKILFNDNTLLSVSESTRLHVTEFAYDARDIKRTTIFTLDRGRIKAEVSEFYAATDSRFEIRTPAGVVAARGTELVVWTSAQDGVFSMGVATLSGRVQVTNVAGQSATLNAGQFTVSSRLSPPKSPAPISANAQIQQLVQRAEVSTATALVAQVSLQMARQESVSRQALASAAAAAVTAVQTVEAQTGSSAGSGGVSPEMGTTNTFCTIVSASGNLPLGCTPP